MKRAICLIALLSAVLPVLLFAQTGAAKYFDSTKPVTLKGTVAGIALMRDRSYLVLEVKDEATNAVQRWAIEGNDRSALLDAGWKLAATPDDQAPQGDGFNRSAEPYRGEPVGVVVYPPRTNAKLEDILGSSPTMIGGVPEGLPPDSPFARLAAGRLRVDLTDLFARGRFVHGTEVTFSNATKLRFGPL